MDHFGGAKYLQDHFHTRVLMSSADWELVAASRSANKPTRDLVVSDGQTLTLGGTTLTFTLTPGHTPGTVSTLIPVTDHGAPHLVAEWGGTGFNFPRAADTFRTYAASAEIQALALRKPGDPHPYVIGKDGVAAYLTVAAECAQAMLAT